MRCCCGDEGTALLLLHAGFRCHAPTSRPMRMDAPRLATPYRKVFMLALRCTHREEQKEGVG